MEGVKTWEQENPDRPVVVMSSDGVARIGLYTLLSYARDQFNLENKVNVIQASYIGIKNTTPRQQKTLIFN